MKSISGKKIKKLLEIKGWIHHRTTGSHWVYKNPVTRKAISIPIHGNRDLPIGTLKSIMKDAELSADDIV
jgi:predicted RNA binding protein YcfA (HicA-like mRNA interferase family)